MHYDIADVEAWRWTQTAFDIIAAIFIQFALPAMHAMLFERIVRARRTCTPPELLRSRLPRDGSIALRVGERVLGKAGDDRCG